MPRIRHLIPRLKEERLLLVLLAGLIILLWLMPERWHELPSLVSWKTIAALAGLLVLSRGLEDSGYLAHAAGWLLTRIHGERTLALILILFSAALSAVITNDVALFIVVPLTLGLRQIATLPIGRLIIFEALAVNAGSTISPVGNPQNLFLWQSSEATFLEFLIALLPLGIGLMLLLLAVIPLAFPARRIELNSAVVEPVLNKRLFQLSLALYPVFLIFADLGHAIPAACLVILLYLFVYRRVVFGVDWLLIVVFILMFVDLGLLARLPAIAALGSDIDQLYGGVFTAGVLLSQIMSNVPAVIFLETFTDDWRLLAWGASVGGFGLAVGSLANLIALRLARQPGLWREFHYWSLPVLAGSYGIGAVLLNAIG